MSRSTGFTLIELLLVLAVVAVLSAIAAGVGSRDRLAVSQAATGLARDVQSVRFEAIRQNEFVGLQVSTADNSYVLYVDEVRDGTYAVGTEFKTVDLGDAGVTFASVSGNGIRFDPRGVNPSPSMDELRFTLESRSGNHAQSVCVTAQGRTRVVPSRTCTGE